MEGERAKAWKRVLCVSARVCFPDMWINSPAGARRRRGFVFHWQQNGRATLDRRMKCTEHAEAFKVCGAWGRGWIWLDLLGWGSAGA